MGKHLLWEPEPTNQNNFIPAISQDYRHMLINTTAMLDENMPQNAPPNRCKAEDGRGIVFMCQIETSTDFKRNVKKQTTKTEIDGTRPGRLQ